MTVELIRSKLISIGYHPLEVEYTLSEVLQHKNPDFLNEFDIKLLISMLEERMQLERAKASLLNQSD